MEVITTKTVRGIIPRARRRVPTASCAAVPGTSNRGASGRRTGTGTTRTPATSNTVSGWPFRPNDYFLSSEFLFSGFSKSGVWGSAPSNAFFTGGVIQESPIFTKTYEFTRWLLEHTIRFPKSQRFVMAKRIEDAILNFYDLLLLAVKVDINRKDTLQKAGYELEKVKHYLRLSKDMGLFSLRQYEYTSIAVVEIGKLLGGWMKKV
jgi:hypothetical protein